MEIDHARVVREGSDLSIITCGASLHKALAAAETLALSGISSEVIDLRTLRPLDDRTIMASVARTRRALVVDEGWRSGGISAEISARITEQVFYELDVPELNGFWLGGRHQLREEIHIGFAIALRTGGLIAPASHDVNRLTLDELMAALRDLITRTRSGHLRSSEMTDATITVTNLGDLGVTTVYGIIYPPQVALVGFGRIAERPWAENGMLGVRRAVTATLSGDHRATDGHRGARFLDALDRHLQAPEKL